MGPYYDSVALLDRLTEGARQSARPVVFLVGSALSTSPDRPQEGIPDAQGMIDLVRSYFEGDSASALEEAVNSAPNSYQAAMEFLLSRRGQNAINDLVKSAVWRARRATSIGDSGGYVPTSRTSETSLHQFDSECSAWHLPPATAALGALAAQQPELFGRSILTTNFDPLIRAAIGVEGGASYRTVMHRDGDFSQTHAEGCHVVHLHGYWYGSDTLHTPRQLTQERPRLKASLAHHLRDKTLVVCGYGGWDDVFTRTLFDLIEDDREKTEIIWTLFNSAEEMAPSLSRHLEPGIARGVVNVYEHIDCHKFLPSLAASWLGTSTREAKASVLRGTTRSTITTHIEGSFSRLPPYRIAPPSGSAVFIHSEREQDRPPIVEHYVGRTAESKKLDENTNPIVFLTGIGGQGKSALASNFLARHRDSGRYTHIVWRDCKEEGERFEAQIRDLVYELQGRQVTLQELNNTPNSSLFDLFIESSRGLQLLIIFDNVDHLIDLERSVPTGSIDQFIRRIADSEFSGTTIFTCRPHVDAVAFGAIELRLQGLEIEATRELFRLRNAGARDEDIQDAHALTKGHAFWLDLIAAQVARSDDELALQAIVRGIPVGDAELPVATLRSIWGELKDRERIVLQGLAEAVKPITALQLLDYLTSHIRWNQLTKSLKYLRACNLIVVKIKENGSEVLELHPLVRAFVRQTVPRSEQEGILESILRHYTSFFGVHRKQLDRRIRPDIIERWLDAAEIYMSAKRYDNAFDLLNEIKPHVQTSGYIPDFVRIATSLAYSQKWNEDNIPPTFDYVFAELVEYLSYAERVGDCLSLLDIYRETVPSKNARYINYCDMMCHFHWCNGEYVNAIHWGSEGVKLKTDSGVDTSFDSGHNLALAQRDSGALDEALAYFLDGNSLQDICQPGAADTSKHGPFYGNIGRCLQLMGQFEGPLVCFKKSAEMLEIHTTNSTMTNKAFIRQWVGELLYTNEDYEAASAFLAAAIDCWKLVSPARADAVERRFGGDPAYVHLTPMSGEVGEELFSAWVRD